MIIFFLWIGCHEVPHHACKRTCANDNITRAVGSHGQLFFILLGLVICLFDFYSSPNWKELSRSRLVQFRFFFAVVFEMFIHSKYYSLVIRAGYISSKPIRCLRPCISWTWFSAFSSFYSCRVECITFKQLRSQRLMLQGHVQKLRRIC